MWGTVISVDVRDDVAAGVVDAVFAWFGAVDALFSTWRSDSEISRVAAGALSLDEASDAVRSVLALAGELHAFTDGAFDIYVGSDPRVARWEGLGTIDPSGVVKGWALDHAAVMLRRAGAGNFAVNAGGDVIVGGHVAPGEKWPIGIQHPSARDKLACTVAVTDCGVATSGRYERGDHIIDPRTGAPATALVAATVVHESLAVADAIATALVAMGDDAPQWLLSHPAVAAFLIHPTETTSTTEAFAALRI